MKTLEEQLEQVQSKAKAIRRQTKERERKERRAKEKINQRRNYIVGELACKHFPHLLELAPGTKQENSENFKDFDLFLEALSKDKELCKQIHERANASKGIYSVVRQDISYISGDE